MGNRIVDWCRVCEEAILRRADRLASITHEIDLL